MKQNPGIDKIKTTAKGEVKIFFFGPSRVESERKEKKNVVWKSKTTVRLDESYVYTDGWMDITNKNYFPPKKKKKLMKGR